jgi:hypothetical protein
LFFKLLPLDFTNSAVREKAEGRGEAIKFIDEKRQWGTRPESIGKLGLWLPDEGTHSKFPLLRRLIIVNVVTDKRNKDVWCFG